METGFRTQVGEQPFRLARRISAGNAYLSSKLGQQPPAAKPCIY